MICITGITSSVAKTFRGRIVFGPKCLLGFSNQHAKSDKAGMSYQNQCCSDTASLLDCTGIEATAHLCLV